MAPIATDNKVIHGMWYGTQLSKMELLTLHSFTDHGHEFHLWAYDDLSAHAMPRGVVVRNATEIIPRRKVFVKTSIDPETGVGRNSLGAPFSDLFRYKLLERHGGIWVDMDVTCLKPFDFESEYVFRPHRIGVVGSILKCPQGSPFIRKVHNETARTVSPESEYLLPNKILTKHVNEMGLAHHIVDEISNPDHFMHYIRPLIEGPAEIPDQWHAIHWINEMWRTLQDDDGHYRGEPLLNYVPDKNNPLPGSVLWEFYRKYGLIDRFERAPRTISAPARLGTESPEPPIRTAAQAAYTPTCLNMVTPSMARGGAERSIAETMTALQTTPGLRQRLYVLDRLRRQYHVRGGDNLRVIYPDGAADRLAAIRAVGWDLLQESTPLVYANLLGREELKTLWEMGVFTVPVVQNMSPSWTAPVETYDDPHVPFVVGVSDAVSAELRAAGCPKPVITIRHELQRSFSPEDLARQRREVRNRHGIPDDALLIGMVGQFKSQKAYTRAVRVLHRVQEATPARLMILGGWDHEYGGGRTAYEAVCRRAVELGVIADMVTPGDVHPVEPYYAAFDVFLNTSLYEGLSVAMLEAIAAGCPVVAADAGGNREILPENGVVVADGSDIEAYARGVLSVGLRPHRLVPGRPVDPTLVPRLWTLIAKHGLGNSRPQAGLPSGTLFLTQNLQIGGPQTSLVNLVSGLSPAGKMAVCMLEGEPLATHKARLDRAGAPIYSAAGADNVVERAEFVLTCIDTLNVRNLCFWNVGPEMKLMLTKVLSLRDIRVVDVSPGQMLFDELDAASGFQRRVSLNARQYFERLDAFVAKHADGRPPPELGVPSEKTHVIPNGVRPAPNYIPLPPAEALAPPDLNRALAISACCRIVPDKKIEFLLDMMAILNERQPGASLAIVGGPDDQSQDYFQSLVAQVEDRRLRNVFFVGPYADVLPCLKQTSVFVMVSDRQGCPNASLEAMSLGLPVVCNASGGSAEQVSDGVNGYLVATPEEMAERVIALQKNSRLLRRMGAAGRNIALKRFSLEAMHTAYANLLAAASAT